MILIFIKSKIYLMMKVLINVFIDNDNKYIYVIYMVYMSINSIEIY